MVCFAKITPPTAQNFAQMEADLWQFAPTVLDLPHEETTLACEHLVRTYDPCISCATHFLTLKVDRGLSIDENSHPGDWSKPARG